MSHKAIGKAQAEIGQRVHVDGDDAKLLGTIELDGPPNRPKPALLTRYSTSTPAAVSASAILPARGTLADLPAAVTDHY
jgi:hypothetical protein